MLSLISAKLSQIKKRFMPILSKTPLFKGVSKLLEGSVREKVQSAGHNVDVCLWMICVFVFNETVLIHL